MIGVEFRHRQNMGSNRKTLTRDSDHAECEGVLESTPIYSFQAHMILLALAYGAQCWKRLSDQLFSAYRHETWSVCRARRVLSRGTIGSPLRPPILGEFRGKAKTLTPNISSPEGGRGAFPVPKDARRGSLLRFQTSGAWAPPLIFGGFFPEISDFFGGQKADCRSSVKNLTRP